MKIFFSESDEDRETLYEGHIIERRLARFYVVSVLPVAVIVSVFPHLKNAFTYLSYGYVERKPLVPTRFTLKKM